MAPAALLRRVPVRSARLVASLAGAALSLVAGFWVAVVLDGRDALPVTAVLLLVPALSAAVPTHRLEPVARAVIALGWTLALDTVVAQAMLSLGAWDVRLGVLVVTGVSVAVWVGVELGTTLSRRAAAERAAEVGP
ncbi:hypothetical protein EV188_11193 [Actinomycetospora succinea]|uniref:Uncharacterized protein n=1 Tax=Actinomycetospora succinea TaxID=663603 RepID=A0A4R6UT95_9PSEU|nr:hypothetical protein [Actinomycetospora succinea]TDQ48923.1 hypothetical protein EV188_11193 [Actinomycetospora succinea]